MAAFILRNIDPAWWQRVKLKALAEHTSLKALIYRVLNDWLVGP